MGDVFSSTGCEFLIKTLPRIKKEEQIDFTVVNGENSAVGNGISKESADMIFAAGADVITGGNHTLKRQDIYPALDQNPFLLRPHNLKADYGKGYILTDTGKYSVAVINLMGTAFMSGGEISNPFLAADKLLETAKKDGADFTVVDFHAEATGEKKALGLYLDGRVTAFFGTHTHIATADACVLGGGTGYITDIGFTGVEDSVLGVKKEIIINRLKSGDMSKFEAADGKRILCGCIFETDRNGLCRNVKQIIIREEEN